MGCGRDYSGSAAMITIIYKGKEIQPYEGFYHNTSMRFLVAPKGGHKEMGVLEVLYERDLRTEPKPR